MNPRARCCCLLVLLGLLGHIRAQSLKMDGFEITWTNRGQQTDFKIASPLGRGVTPSSAWMGIGFNKNAQMNGASVVICTNSPSGSAVQHNLNQNYNSQVLDTSNRQLGLSNVAVSVQNGMLTCSFTRDNSNANANYFDLNQNSQAYVILGYGLLSSTGDIMFHAFRSTSSSSVSFAAPAPTTTSAPPTTTVTTTIPTTTTRTTTIPVTTTAQVTTATALTTSLSAEIGSFLSGDFSVSWAKSSMLANGLDFTVSYSTASMSDIYVAVAFSTDSIMGGDDVVACAYAANLKEVARYYNPAGHMAPVKQANNNGISNQAISLANGKLSCSFTRAMALNEANFFDLSSPHYLLVAAGATNDAGGLFKHTARIASPTALNFQPTSPASTTPAPATTTTTTKSSASSSSTSILTTITQTASTTQRPNPIVYFSTLIKNFFTKLFQFFGARS